jgi:hypothetical protein
MAISVPPSTAAPPPTNEHDVEVAKVKATARIIIVAMGLIAFIAVSVLAVVSGLELDLSPLGRLVP